MDRRLAGQMVGRSIMTLLPGLSAVGASEGPRPVVPAVPRAQTFRDFYHAHVEFVWRGARRLGVDDAAVDDVVQHVFLVAYRRFPEFRLHDFPGGGSVKAWVFAILVRAVREYRRSTRRKSPHVGLPHTDPETLADSRELGPHEALAKVEAARLVRRLLEELDDDKREVFVLAELEQLTTLEISSVVGVNPSTVSSRLRAARRDFERAAERHRRRDTWRLG